MHWRTVGDQVLLAVIGSVAALVVPRSMRGMAPKADAAAPEAD
ncbi:hypothetical protein ACI7YT_17300 [Microbacterium sp. M]